VSKAQKNPVAWIKIYGPSNDYRGSLVSTDDAAVLCAVLGTGSEARNGHRKANAIWREGFESVSASESYDAAAAIMNERMQPIFTSYEQGAAWSKENDGHGFKIAA
jgi:hypothetical protein